MELLSWNGLNIYPLPAEFTVDVTQADIDNGIPGSCTDCAITLAVCRALGIPSIGVMATGGWGLVLYTEPHSPNASILLGASIAEWVPECGELENYQEFQTIFDEHNREWSKPTSFTFTLDSDINLKEIQL